MVLSPQKATIHNRMAGKRIPHPASTRFNEGVTSPVKKRKKTDIKNEDSSDDSAKDTLNAIRATPRDREDPDATGEGDSGNEADPSPPHVTELESALPPIDTDKKAIEEYESLRAGEDASAELKARLHARTWVQGRSSIYVDAFNLALDTVLEDESHLFDAAESKVFEIWRNLDYEAQYLWVCY